MASSIGPNSIPITACACRSASSAISSRARTPAGPSSRGFSSRCAMSTVSSSGTKANGRWPGPNGRGSISIRKDSVLSSTEDADIFVVLRVFAPDDGEVVFQGALDPHTPIGQGWLRASHRKLDPALSTPYRPYHSHDERQRLTPGEPVELDIEIWPTSIIVPPGYRIALTIRGKDYEH